MRKRAVGAASVTALALAVAATIAYWRLRGRKPTRGQLNEINELVKRIQETLANPESPAAKRLAKLLQRLAPAGVGYVDEQSIAAFLLQSLGKLTDGTLGDDEAIGFEALMERLEEAADRESL